jgi:hypothetical protein
MPWCKHR